VLHSECNTIYSVSAENKLQQVGELYTYFLLTSCKGKKVKERIFLRVIHLRTTGHHLSMGSHCVICHPTVMAALYAAFIVEYYTISIMVIRTEIFV